jgi:hypothetical protein
MHLIMVFLIKIGRKLLLSLKYVHIINIFFLNKKKYDEILSFLTKVGNMGFGKMESAI